jgi:hypothetical protein
MAWSTLIRLDLLSALSPGRPMRPRRRPRPSPAPAADALACRAAAPEPAPGSDERPACGWFDSSHELNHGLQVTEYVRPEVVAQMVPLRWWLAWELDAVAPPIAPITPAAPATPVPAAPPAPSIR